VQRACDFRVSSRALRQWITATLLIATAALAQQTHNQYEPPNAPGAGQRLLAQFTGDWDVVKTFFPMTGKPMPPVADEQHTVIHSLLPFVNFAG
jgi:hypothetical protein